MRSNGSAGPRWTSWDLQASVLRSLTARSVVSLSTKFHLTGFGYHFNSMTSSPDKLNVTFQTIFRGTLKPTTMAMLQSFVPPLRLIVSCRTPTVPYRGSNANNAIPSQPEQKMQRDKKFADAKAVMRQIGARLVQERKLALSKGASEDDAEEGLECGKDLLSLLVKASNMSDPEAASMSDEDVQDRESASHSPFTYGVRRAQHIFSFPHRIRHFHPRWP